VALDVIQEMVFLPLEKRILRRLEWIATGYGSRVKPCKQVRIPQEGIAQMMGVSRQSANKAMKTLEAVGLISRNYGVVELHNSIPEERKPSEPIRMLATVRRFKRELQGPETVF
jgi:CRP-like cAMP-binding protein